MARSTRGDAADVSALQISVARRLDVCRRLLGRDKTDGPGSPFDPEQLPGSLATLQQADRLLQLVQISVEAIASWSEERYVQAVRLQLDFAVDLIAEGRSRSVAPLRSFERDLLIPWNELPWESTKPFWLAAEREGLPYRRTDRLTKILQRDAIRSRADYDLALDSLPLAAQEGRISPSEGERLAELVALYEQKQSLRRPTRPSPTPGPPALGRFPTSRP